jgi:hypothetical protein
MIPLDWEIPTCQSVKKKVKIKKNLPDSGLG